MAVGILHRYPLEDGVNGHVSSLTLSADGYEGTRYAMVQADDIGEAINTPGLPRVGDKWSPTVGAVCRSVGNPICYEGRTDNGMRFWIVQIQYDSPRFGTAETTLYRAPGDAMTEIAGSTEQQTIYYPVSDGGTLKRWAVDENGVLVPGITIDETPINNGEGTSIEIGTLSASVSVWYAANQAPDYARLTRLMRPNKLNNAAVSLPPLDRSTQRINFDAWQVRYRGWSPTVELSGAPGVDGLPTPLLRVTHALSLSEHHDHIWQAQNAAGEPNGRYWYDRLYRDADFTGIWP